MTLRTLPFPRLALLALLAPMGCALFGGSDRASKRASVDEWQADAKSRVAAKAPEAEADLVRHIDQQRGRVHEATEQVTASSVLLCDAILGEHTYLDHVPAKPVTAWVGVMRKYSAVPKLVPFEDRRLNHFFEDLPASAKKKMAKAAVKPAVREQLNHANGGLQGVAYNALLEHDRAVTANWNAELMSFYLGSKVITHERLVEDEVGEEVLDEIARMLEDRAQSRALLATQTAILGLYEGVSDGGDPESLLVLARSAKAQYAARTKVSREEARAFVDGMQGEALDIAAVLEASMRTAVGDQSYEKVHQKTLVRVMEDIEKAQQTTSVYDQIDAQAKQAKRAETKQQLGSMKDRLTARAQELGMAKAKEVIGGLPYGSQFLAGADALGQLRAGNARGALEAAANAAPPGPIGEGIRTALKLAFAVADKFKGKGKRGRGRRRG